MNVSKIVKAVLMVSVLAFPMSAFSAGDHGGNRHSKKKAHSSKQGKKVAIKGEVIDLSCYMNHEGSGKKHQKCATSCILDKSLPVGLLTASGKVYVIVEDHSKPKAYQQIKELAAKQVKVKGKKYIRGGMKAISILGVEVLKK
jgi:hypothetical protein